VIVVTGARGVIGRALMALLERKSIDSLGLHRGMFDLASTPSLVDAIGGRPEAIIHLAAAVPHSHHHPDVPSSADMTRAMDRVVHDAARHWRCRVIYASTCSLYDKHSPLLKQEHMPVVPRSESPYMQAKYEGEQLLSSLPNCCILRVPAPIGPGLPGTVVAQRFLSQALAGQTLRVWGSGRREQNYVDVTDLADSFFRATTCPVSGIFNLAAPKPTTMLELAQAMVSVVRRGSVEMAGVSDPLEPEYARYSISRASDLLGWQPQVALESSIDLMREYHNVD